MKRICDERINRGREISRLNASGLLIAAAIALSGPCSTAEAGTPDIMVLHSFGATVGDGATPSASVVLGNDGNFYGTTEYGGTYGYGTVFKITSSGSLTTLYSFGTVPHDGGLPAAGLIQAQDGKFYGTTASGGAYDYGTVFNITTSGSLTTQFSFYYAGDIGFAPQASLVQDSDGSFYGTTAAGGAYINGTVFKITPSGSEFTLHSFTGIADNGSSPCAGLVQGRDGNFYGTTIAGGVGGGYGTVFKITPSGLLSILYSFGSAAGDGATPFGGLVEGSDGNFYGTTAFDGAYGQGTVYKITPSGSLTTLYSFGAEANDGASSLSGLVQGSDRNFYGTTYSGGAYGEGTAFRITPSGVLTTLYSFGGVAGDGAQPNAALVQGTDGNFYGTTSFGGAYGEGTVFLLQAGIQATPSAPIGLSANAGNAQAKLTWQASAGASSYSIYEGTSPGGESSTPVMTGITGTNAVVTGLTSGTTYYFEVTAVGPGGTSGMSNEAKATPFVLPGKIASLVAQSGKLEALLRWTVAPNASSYVVLRSTVPGAEKPVAEGITTTKYTATGLDAGTTYYFKVAGMNASGIGPTSSEVSVMPQ